MSSPIPQQQAKAQAFFAATQNQLIQTFETLEGGRARFVRQKWRRRERGKTGDFGGGESALVCGKRLEKAGVHCSTVYGRLDATAQRTLSASGSPLAGESHFWASGISVIVHPHNPHAPAAHMNLRMIATKTQTWFGGGADLTPMLRQARRATAPDVRAFHASLRAACATLSARAYPRYKKACDAYFMLPHRGEPRGAGGIFFDELQSTQPKTWLKSFNFVQAVARAFQDSYPRILRRRLAQKWSARARAEQLQWRARYAEFNLLYDRGTRFGLQTGGNTTAILSSLPPLVAWT